MPTAISDGTGTGSLTKVTDGRLQVEANLRPFISFKAKGATQAFAFPSINTADLDAAGNIIYALKYTGTSGGFVITRIILFSDQAVELAVTNNTGTAASGTAVTEAQLNFGSTIPSNVSAMSSAAAAKLTGLTEQSVITYFQLPGAGSAIVEPEEVPIITPGRTFAIKINDITGSNPTRMGITVWGYESDLEL